MLLSRSRVLFLFLTAARNSVRSGLVASNASRVLLVQRSLGVLSSPRLARLFFFSSFFFLSPLPLSLYTYLGFRLSFSRLKPASIRFYRVLRSFVFLPLPFSSLGPTSCQPSSSRLPSFLFLSFPFSPSVRPVLLVYRGATLGSPILRVSSSYSYSYTNPRLLPSFVVPLLTLLLFYPLPARVVFFALLLFVRLSFYLVSKSIPIRQRPRSSERHCRNWSIEERFSEEAANTSNSDASGCRCRCCCCRRVDPRLRL